MTKNLIPLASVLFLCLTSIAQANNKTILFINSYHPGYEWSDGVERGIEQVLANQGITLHKFYMDTKRQRKPEQIENAVALARQEIASLKPDLVIASDDNAAKYIIQPYYREDSLPFVFCGVNWDSSVYGFPYSNVTGMEEVALIKPIVKHLQDYAKGERLGIISIDANSGHRNIKNFEKELGNKFDKTYFVNTFAEWKERYLQLQREVDMMILENPKGIDNWDNEQARIFVEQNTRIPVGTTHIWLSVYAHITIAKIPEEQGQWAASTALKILNGNKPASIPIVKNQKGRLFANLRLSQLNNITFKHELIEIAEIIR